MAGWETCLSEPRTCMHRQHPLTTKEILIVLQIGNGGGQPRRPAKAQTPVRAEQKFEFGQDTLPMSHNRLPMAAPPAQHSPRLLYDQWYHFLMVQVTCSDRKRTTISNNASPTAMGYTETAVLHAQYTQSDAHTTSGRAQ